MRVWAGPSLVAVALLLVSGALKARPPSAVRAGSHRSSGPLARLAPAVGIAELVVALGALTVDNRILPALAGTLYLAFSVFVALALTAEEPVADCGCFGAAETTPTPMHLVLNLGAAAACGAVAWQSGGTLVRAVEGQPLLGLPLLLLTGICVFLAYAALTVAPRARAVAGT